MDFIWTESEHTHLEGLDPIGSKILQQSSAERTSHSPNELNVRQIHGSYRPRTRPPEEKLRREHCDRACSNLVCGVIKSEYACVFLKSELCGPNTSPYFHSCCAVRVEQETPKPKKKKLKLRPKYQGGHHSSMTLRIRGDNYPPPPIP